jgi:hypothetical protein
MLLGVEKIGDYLKSSINTIWHNRRRRWWLSEVEALSHIDIINIDILILPTLQMSIFLFQMSPMDNLLI